MVDIIEIPGFIQISGKNRVTFRVGLWHSTTPLTVVHHGTESLYCDRVEFCLERSPELGTETKSWDGNGKTFARTESLRKAFSLSFYIMMIHMKYASYSLLF